MLKDDLYTLKALQREDDRLNATLQINPQHAIFKGHFPGQPVLPGACMLQMIKEVLEDVLHQPLRLKKADHLKFLAVIDPSVNPVLELSLTYGFVDDLLIISTSLSAGDAVCLKMKAAFVML